MTGTRLHLAAGVLAASAALPCTAAAAGQEPVRLLDVPYLPQSEALCGGAAAAMVMRYWGTREIHAETFADLVREDEGGIRGEDLLRAARARGWRAESFRGDAAIVARHVALGRPVIALVEDRPGAFHYVVVVGWLPDRVVSHDPARAPFRIQDEASFLRAWSVGGFWTMLVLPGGEERARAAEVARPAGPVSRGGACEPMLAEGVRLAQAGQTSQAIAVLDLAARVCGREAAPLRELAGVHARRGDWSEAETRAREALARDPADAHASRILGTSLYLQGRPEEALAAWNAVGEPVVDLVNVSGLERTRYAVAARLLRTPTRDVLTPDLLSAAGRRLAELPSAQSSRVTYAPAGGGRANVEAAIVERPLLPTGPVALSVLGLRAAIEREGVLTIASALGSGETMQAGWRWWSNRPAGWVTVAAPGPAIRAGAVWSARVGYARETFGSGGSLEETRRGGAFTVSDWIGGGWRWQAGVGLQRWNGRGAAWSLEGALARRAAHDRAAVGGAVSVYGGGVTTATASLDAAWQSARAPRGRVLHVRAGLAVAGDEAPLDLWPGAGTGQGREPLLRAHPLLDDGTIRDGVFGRTVAHGGVEWRAWISPASRPLLRLAPAVFVDVARASRSHPGFDTRAHADVGAGVRVGLSGAGVLRIDLARGLRDGTVAFSAGFVR